MYDPICVVIERTSDLNTVTVQEVVGFLKSYELQLSRHVDDTIGLEKAFASMSLTPIHTTSPLCKEISAKLRRIGSLSLKIGIINYNMLTGKVRIKKWVNRNETSVIKLTMENDGSKGRLNVTIATNLGTR